MMFTPKKIGQMEIRNRFVHSATYEAMALPTGEVTENMVKKYRKLAHGGVGLIIPGYMFIHPHGKAAPLQTGIHSGDMIPGLRRLTEAAHAGGAKIFFQIAHAGAQTSRKYIGRRPLGPAGTRRDPVYLSKPVMMTEEDIGTVVRSFGEAAGRAAEAGADGVQLHAAHGYLLSQFLSPFFNTRRDRWGGSAANRFRIMEEIYGEVRRSVPKDMPVIVKINAYDYVPKDGVSPDLAKMYSGWLAGLGVDGIEVSCSCISFSFMNMIRGDVPVNELVQNFPFWKKFPGKIMMKRLVGKFDLEEGYNVDGARVIKSAIGSTPLMVVGGMRTAAYMERVLNNGPADFISLARPFVREPGLVNRIKEGKTIAASCGSCNQCFAAVSNSLPLKCYNKTLPPADSLR